MCVFKWEHILLFEVLNDSGSLLLKQPQLKDPGMKVSLSSRNRASTLNFFIRFFLEDSGKRTKMDCGLPQRRLCLFLDSEIHILQKSSAI